MYNGNTDSELIRIATESADSTELEIELAERLQKMKKLLSESQLEDLKVERIYCK